MTTETQIESYTEAVVVSVNNYEDDIDEAILAAQRLIDGNFSEVDEILYYDTAKNIVDPFGIYNDLMDTNPDNWFKLIATTTDPKWGEFAKLVTEYGY